LPSKDDSSKDDTAVPSSKDDAAAPSGESSSKDFSEKTFSLYFTIPKYL